MNSKRRWASVLLHFSNTVWMTVAAYNAPLWLKPEAMWVVPLMCLYAGALLLLLLSCLDESC